MVQQTSQLAKLFWLLIKLVHTSIGDRQPKVQYLRTNQVRRYAPMLHFAPVLFLESPMLHF